MGDTKEYTKVIFSLKIKDKQILEARAEKMGLPLASFIRVKILEILEDGKTEKR
jgi:hypothetical protein